MSFGVSPNARTKHITFDIIDMVYPYNTIIGRGSINKLEATIQDYTCAWRYLVSMVPS
jgi:hypothetical protein